MHTLFPQFVFLFRLLALVEVSVASFKINFQQPLNVIFARSQKRMFSHSSVKTKLSLERRCTFRSLSGLIISFADSFQDIVFEHRTPFQFSKERPRLGHSLRYS